MTLLLACRFGEGVLGRKSNPHSKEDFVNLLYPARSIPPTDNEVKSDFDS